MGAHAPHPGYGITRPSRRYSPALQDNTGLLTEILREKPAIPN